MNFASHPRTSQTLSPFKDLKPRSEVDMLDLPQTSSKSPESPLHLSMVRFSTVSTYFCILQIRRKGVTRSEDELQQVMRAVSRPLCLGKTSGPGQAGYPEEPRHHCWGEGQSWW